MLFICLLAVAPRSSATSIVAITTRHGILIGADGMVLLNSSGGRRATGTGTKIILLNNKTIIAECGDDTLIVGPPRVTLYSFGNFIQSLNSKVSSRTSLTETLGMLTRALSQTSGTINGYLASGFIKRENLVQPGDVLLRFYVAGYESSHPRVYTVELAVDWFALHLDTPSVSLACPDPLRKNICFYFTGGTQHGIIELGKGIRTDATIRAMRVMPSEVQALREDRDIPLGQALKLAHGLLDIEVLSNPDTVGYPLTIFTITPSGAKKHGYAASLR